MTSTDIVVGVDGSSPSRMALRWAAAEARRRDERLRILAVAPRSWLDAGHQERAFQRAQDLVTADVMEARTLEPDIEVLGAVVFGDPAQELTAASRGAAMVVVGNRSRGTVRSVLLGSVNQRLATRAEAPVVVVRGQADTTRGSLVVGVDDSAGAERALGLAFDEADRRRCPLVAMHGYGMPQRRRGPAVPPPAAIEWLDAIVDPWREKYPAVLAQTLACRRDAGPMLVTVSRFADLVVVGSRGHGPVAGTLLGSVGLHLLHHAQCPVMIAHPVP